MTGTLISIQVGKPEHRGDPSSQDPMRKRWYSAIYKSLVIGPVLLRETNLEGDGQADSRHHGGYDKALLGYSADHYPKWRTELNLSEISFGMFGENFTIAGMDESTVCIGDQYSIGPVRVEVSQPRQPCFNLARRWEMKEMPALVKQNGRAGWYLRVLREGIVEAGMNVELIARPYPEWSVLRAFRTMNERRSDPRTAEALASLPPLSMDWKEELLAG